MSADSATSCATELWAAYGSWKWYFDEYLCDIGFYSEEFGKMGSTPGAMLVYCFALVGFYAYNRPVYLNRQVTPGYAQDWSRSVQSHCGVTVDGAEPTFTDATTVRKAFSEPVKFVAARSHDVYPDVDLTRSLMLTGEYLLDVTQLVSKGQHEYSWFLHALGQTEPGQTEQWKDSQLPEDLCLLKDVRAYQAGAKPWSVKVIQTCALEEPSKGELPEQPYLITD